MKIGILKTCLILHEKVINDGNETFYQNRGQSMWIKKIN